MKKALYMFFLLFVLTFQIQAQKVGLVLSGGGAKGLTHIGIIRALEENHIPIDYIAGTSMGAIVGSLYAMGYSPDDMERLLKSDSFKRWYTGNIEEKYIYYFKKNPPTPEFLNIRVSLKNPLHKVKTQFLPSSVVDPLQMNLAFLELFGQATAACNNDFNQLFVPFRCVASDVYNKRPMIFEKGDLGDAVTPEGGKAHAGVAAHREYCHHSGGGHLFRGGLQCADRRDGRGQIHACQMYKPSRASDGGRGSP